MAIPYARQVDTIFNSPSTDITTTYRGEATIGSATTAAAWRIRRIRTDDNTGGDMIEVWAESGGSATSSFIFKWTDRLTLTYS